MKKIIFFLSFVLFNILMIVLRVVELKYMLNPLSGFFQDKYTAISLVIYAVGFLGCLAFGFLCYFSLRKESQNPVPPKSSFLMGCASLILSLGIFSDIGKSFLTTNDYIWADYLVVVLSFICAFIFLSWGISYFFGKKNIGILTALPIIWSVTRLILNYTRFNGIALTTENMVDVLAMAFFMMFWLYYSKLVLDIKREKSLRNLFIFGSFAATLGLVSTLPRFFVDYELRNDMLSHNPPVSFTSLSSAIFIICFLGVLYLQKKKEPEVNNKPQVKVLEDEELALKERPRFTVSTIDNKPISDDYFISSVEVENEDSQPDIFIE